MFKHRSNTSTNNTISKYKFHALKWYQGCTNFIWENCLYKFPNIELVYCFQRESKMVLSAINIAEFKFRTQV